MQLDTLIRFLMRRTVALCAMLLSLALLAAPAWSRGVPEEATRDLNPVIALSELPPEARETVGLIRNGGLFPYERDGSVFGNFERALPARGRGYYREFTVRTPGVRHRGARRIVAGRDGELYYTADHYVSFKRIRE